MKRNELVQNAKTIQVMNSEIFNSLPIFELARLIFYKLSYKKNN